MRGILRNVSIAVLLLGIAQAVCALDLPWQREGKQADAAEAPKLALSVPDADSDTSPRMDIEYVGGKTIRLGVLSIAVPEGWYRAEKKDEEESQAYLFLCIPRDREDPVCLLNIAYDFNEQEEGAQQIPDFLKFSREYLEEDGEWKAIPLKIGGRNVQCLRNTDSGDESLLMVQYVLKTCIPSIYVFIPSRNAVLPAEAAAFIAGIEQK